MNCCSSWHYLLWQAHKPYLVSLSSLRGYSFPVYSMLWPLTEITPWACMSACMGAIAQAGINSFLPLLTCSFSLVYGLRDSFSVPAKCISYAPPQCPNSEFMPLDRNHLCPIIMNVLRLAVFGLVFLLLCVIDDIWEVMLSLGDMWILRIVGMLY